MNSSSLATGSSFPFEQFYSLPQHWLELLNEPSGLDTLDILCFHADETGMYIFFDKTERYRSEQERADYWRNLGSHHGMPDDYPERWWQWPDLYRRLNPLLSRPSYTKQIQRLLTQASLREAEESAAWKYQFTQSAESVHQTLYRPRGYLYHRWPVWLGAQDLASRAILVVFLNEVAAQTLAHNAMPTAIVLSQAQIAMDLIILFGERSWLPGMVQAALSQLKILAVLDEVAGNGEPQEPSYRLQVNRFDAIPQWSPSEIRFHCRPHQASDPLWLDIFVAVLRTCSHPVTRVKTLWNQLLEEYIHSGNILPFGLDLRRLQSFLRHIDRYLAASPKAHIPDAADTLRLFVTKRLRHAYRRIGAEFSLLTQAVDIQCGLQMPHPSAHYLDATQLEITYESDPSLDQARAISVLRNLQFLVWQTHEANEPTLIPLHPQLPKIINETDPILVRCNHLHKRLDYNRPFDLLLRCDIPTPLIRLTCRFVLLHTRPVRGKRKS